MHDFGWGGDHIGKLVALQTAMRKLSGQGKLRDRYDAATFALVTYRDEEFPEPLRPALNRIKDARRKARQDVSETYTYFAFDFLTPTERKQVAADITALYEACLIDLGRTWPKRDFMYPKGELIAKPIHRRKPTKA